MSKRVHRASSILLLAVILMVLTTSITRAGFVTVYPYCFRPWFSTTLTWGGDADTDQGGNNMLWTELLWKGNNVATVINGPHVNRPWQTRAQ